ncbi:hypothetical protein CRENBAI_019367 [Crenichthys baileyi]|uniref:Secreted protein n=1 Tax=Crenichthys baileyi TaxID=28760 RepID=A0AAV9R7I4_9TELE
MSHLFPVSLIICPLFPSHVSLYISWSVLFVPCWLLCSFTLVSYPRPCHQELENDVQGVSCSLGVHRTSTPRQLCAGEASRLWARCQGSTSGRLRTRQSTCGIKRNLDKPSRYFRLATSVSTIYFDPQ